MYRFVQRDLVAGKTTQQDLDFIKDYCEWWTGVPWAAAKTSDFTVSDRSKEAQERRAMGKLTPHELAMRMEKEVAREAKRAEERQQAEGHRGKKEERKALRAVQAQADDVELGDLFI